MESASAVPSPEASTALPEPEVHSVPTSDGTEVRLTRYEMGTKGPIVLAPGLRQRRARVRARHRAQELGRSTSASTATTSGCSTTARARTCRRASRQFTVDDIALRDWPAAIDTVRRETGADSVQAMGHCVGGLSLFMAIGGGLEGLRSATFSALAGHPIPTPGNQAARRRPHGDGVQGARDQGPRTPTTTPSRCPTAGGRDGDEGRCPFRHVYDNPVARRIYFIYGDVFDYENINKPTMEQAVPSFFGNGNITFFEHISLMIRAGEARDARGEDAYLSNLDALPAADQLHHRRAQPDVRAQGPAAHVRHAAPRRTAREHYTPPRVQGLRPPRSAGWARNAERDVWPTALAELEQHN